MKGLSSLTRIFSDSFIASFLLLLLNAKFLHG